MGSGPDFRVLIAGGGIAALEAALSLRDLVDGAAQIVLVAPDEEFSLRPLAVAEPFGLAPSPRIPYGEIAEELDLDFRRDSIARFDVEGRVAHTAGGEQLPYDAALVAVGAIPAESLPGAVTYGGGPDNASIESILADLDGGEVRSIAFAIPMGVTWSLPLYELTLLTAKRVRSDGIEAELTLITHEARPLELFGPKASESVAGLLSDSGVEVISQARAAAAGPAGVQLADGRIVVADRVIASARLHALPIAGLPTGDDGFLETDLRMEIDGAPRVFAAGDATWFPVKQGGLAAQEADTAASAIASLIDESIEPVPFRPMLRAVLFTGDAPRFLRAELQSRAGTSATSEAPLWWPPGKVAGRHVAAFIAKRSGEDAALADLEPLDDGEEEGDYGEALELALSAADLDARAGDFRSALRWLEVAESVNLSLPAEYEDKRRDWSERAGPG